MIISSIAIFCGAKLGSKAEYISAAEDMGKILAENNIRLIYGGGGVGLMGVLAKSVSNYGGKITGVMPNFLVDKEADRSLSDLRIVGSIKERKAMMAGLSDAFIAMPGGLGTLDEIFGEVLLSHLQIHSKPCGFLNTCNYYDKILDFIKYAMREGFIDNKCKDLLCVNNTPITLLNKMTSIMQMKIDS